MVMDNGDKVADHGDMVANHGNIVADHDDMAGGPRRHGGRIRGDLAAQRALTHENRRHCRNKSRASVHVTTSRAQKPETRSAAVIGSWDSTVLRDFSGACQTTRS